MEQQVVLRNGTGLHARPASMFVGEAAKYKSDVFVAYNGKRVNAKSILGLLTLGVGKGQTVTIITEGPDEEDAAKSLVKMVESGFGE